jgi:hypothetical protein
MLINTVVLFLRELLPFLLLLSALLLWLRPVWRRFLLATVLLTVAALVLIRLLLPQIANSADGLGLELLYASCYGLCCLAIAVALWLNPLQPQQYALGSILGCALAAASLAAINGSNLVLYFFGYQRSDAELANIGLGAVLGIGIGLSVAVLLYHVLQEIRGYWTAALSWLLAILAARQVSVGCAILIQSDLLPAGPVLWNSHGWVDERSEYGHFLYALMGYEATPSALQFTSFVLTLFLIYSCGFRLRRQARATRAQLVAAATLDIGHGVSRRQGEEQ